MVSLFFIQELSFLFFHNEAVGKAQKQKGFPG